MVKISKFYEGGSTYEEVLLKITNWLVGYRNQWSTEMDCTYVCDRSIRLTLILSTSLFIHSAGTVWSVEIPGLV